MQLRKKVIGIVILTLILAGTFYIINYFQQPPISITIYNHTSYNIRNLKIAYHNSKKDIAIPTIRKESSYRGGITPDEDFVENSM